jgi:hypothetical protein
MALKPKNYKSQHAVHKQMQSLSKYKSCHDMIKSFDLQNNNKNLEEQEDNPLDYFLQSTSWLPSY